MENLRVISADSHVVEPADLRETRLDPKFRERAHAAPSIPDPELQMACFRTFNDWLAEYCSAAAKRIYGIALIPLADIELGIKEEVVLTLGKPTGDKNR